MKSKKERLLLRLLKEAQKVRKGIFLGVFLSVLIIAANMIVPKLESNVIEKINIYYLEKTAGNNPGNLLASLSSLFITIVAVYLSKGLFDSLKMLLMNVTVSRHITCAVRIRMSDKIKTLPVSYVDKTQPGEVLSRMSEDVSAMGMTLHSVVDMLTMGILQTVGVSIIMFIINWKLAFVVVGMLPVSIILTTFISKKSEKHFSTYMKKIEEMYSCVEETYSDFATIKAYNFEEERVKAAKEISEGLFESGKKGVTISTMLTPVIVFIESVAYALICLIGGYLAVTNKMSLGGVIAIVLYSKQFASPLYQIADGISHIQRVKVSSRRVYEFLDQEEMEDIREELPKTILGDIIFRDVNFSYSPEKPLIENLSFTVKAGQKVAIVGPTGAGKTTIVNLLMRFYDVQTGEILIDGHNICNMSRESVRDAFSMVLQDAWLFKGSVLDNIAYSKENATKEEIVIACDKAYADHFIRTLPNGYDTQIDEATSNLSGGQKQLLTIARAFLSDRPLLILDEATSSVDTRTEILIQKAMDKLMKDKTAFVIAHRLSTIVNSDIILVIDDGKIVEIGTHDSLLEKNGFYSEIYSSQYAV